MRSGESADYADRVAFLLTHQATARRMGRRARRRAEVRFGADRVADQYADFLRRVAQGQALPNGLEAQPA